jgi:hypothetical protein
MDAPSAMLLSTLYSMYEMDGEEEGCISADSQQCSNLPPGLFLELPLVVIEYIVSYVSLSDLGSLCNTCSSFNCGTGKKWC